jgi:flagella basal body P-ring formation protein FlgA
MLCRSEKPLKVSENGHFSKWPNLLKSGVSVLLWALIINALTLGAQAQSTNKPSFGEQQQINSQLRSWYAKTERVNESSVNVADLDSRLKIEACAAQINFDFPFVSHKTVRARCESPKWQYYLQVSVPLSTDSPAVSNTNTPSNTTSNTSSNTTPNTASQTKTAQPNPTPVGNPIPEINKAPSPPGLPDTTGNAASVATTPKPLPNRPGYHTVITSPQFLKRGTILNPSLFMGTEIAFVPSDSSALSNPSDVAHMELLRDLPANTPLKSFDVKPMLMIKKGQQVLVSIGEGKGFLITVRAEAMQDGQLGDQIRLKNTESGRSISAVVTGVNTAKSN